MAFFATESISFLHQIGGLQDPQRFYEVLTINQIGLTPLRASFKKRETLGCSFPGGKPQVPYGNPLLKVPSLTEDNYLENLIQACH